LTVSFYSNKFIYFYNIPVVKITLLYPFCRQGGKEKPVQSEVPARHSILTLISALLQISPSQT